MLQVSAFASDVAGLDLNRLSRIDALLEILLRLVEWFRSASLDCLLQELIMQLILPDSFVGLSARNVYFVWS